MAEFEIGATQSMLGVANERRALLLRQGLPLMINNAIGASGVASQECKAVVSQYGQTILDLLSAEAPPKKICSQVGLCTFDGNHGVSMGIKSVVDESEGRSSGVMHDAMCSACEMAVVWMRSQLQQNQTQEHVLNYINELCDRVPNPMGESAVDCEKLSSMPNVSFTIGDKVFDLSPNESERDLALSASVASLVSMFLHLVDLSGLDVPWIVQHNSCPVCRQELPPEGSSSSNGGNTNGRESQGRRNPFSYLWPFRSSNSSSHGSGNTWSNSPTVRESDQH